MKMILHGVVYGFCLVAFVCSYDVLEGKFVGERYHPSEKTSLRIRNSRPSRMGKIDQNSVADKSQSAVKDGPGIFARLIQQLSSAIHRKIVDSRQFPTSKETSAHEGRSLSTDKNRKFSEELYYHYYPHNQHLYNLPECATQQVCNAVYVRLNFTQPLCACAPSSDPCSASNLANDEHTIEMRMDQSKSQAVTLVKTCENISNVRVCRRPRDWAILALQNTRTGKAHYLVICKCPDSSKLEGPLNHDQPTYAQVPGIRVYGMMCTSEGRKKRSATQEDIEFPFWRIEEAVQKNNLIQDLLTDESVPPSPKKS